MVLILVLGCDPLVRRSAVCSKSFVFSSLPIRKVLVLPFRAVFLQRVYPQCSRAYYLWFYYLIFNYMSVWVFDRRISRKSGRLTEAESGCLTVENSPESQRSVDNPRTLSQRPSEASPRWAAGKVSGSRLRTLLDGPEATHRGVAKGLPVQSRVWRDRGSTHPWPSHSAGPARRV